MAFFSLLFDMEKKFHFFEAALEKSLYSFIGHSIVRSGGGFPPPPIAS